MAMHPAVGAISSQRERGEMVHDAWRRFNTLNLLSHLVFAATWFAGRGILSSAKARRRARATSAVRRTAGLLLAAPLVFGKSRAQYIDRRTHALVMAKDALIVGSVLSGVTSIIAGQVGMREPGTAAPAPLDASGMVPASAPRRVKVAEAVTGVAGIVNVLTLSGIIAITAALAMKSGKSAKWSLVSRQLP